MPKILHPNVLAPIEREYEAWIIRRIREYYRSIGINIELFAVPPSLEVIFPADHILYANGKMVGLQFKQAKMAKRTKIADDFSQLKWTFHDPPGQFALVNSFPEIFYVLPTFISRDYEDASLHHCLFWRPDSSKPADYNAWYCNKGKTKTPYNSIKESMRWGLFYERLVKCSIGKKLTSKKDLDDFIANLKVQSKKLAATQTVNEEANETSDTGDTSGLYLLLVEHK